MITYMILYNNFLKTLTHYRADGMYLSFSLALLFYRKPSEELYIIKFYSLYR